VIGPAKASRTADADIPEMDLFSQADDFTSGSFVATEFVKKDVTRFGVGSNRPLVIVALVLLIPMGIYLYDETLFPDMKVFKDFLSIFNFGVGDELSQKKKTGGLALARNGQDNVPANRAGFDANGNPLNPYWNLPNHLEFPPNPMSRVWTAQEEEAFNARILHRFQWQRYRAVRDVATERLSGSETVLWEALEQPKLWTRMRAAAALADFGFELSFASAEKALGNAENSLVSRFLQRFTERSTLGDRYLLRQIIRLVDERGRLAILKALAKYPGDLRDLYMVAAQFDPGPSIKEWSRFKTPEIAPGDYRTYKNIVLGKQVYHHDSIAPPASGELQKTKKAGSESDLLKIDNIEIYQVVQPADSSEESEGADPAQDKKGENGVTEAEGDVPNTGSDSAKSGQSIQDLSSGIGPK
jgi:hypothetical protein